VEVEAHGLSISGAWDRVRLKTNTRTTTGATRSVDLGLGGTKGAPQADPAWRVAALVAFGEGPPTRDPALALSDDDLECEGTDEAGNPVTLRLSVNGVLIAEATDPNGLAAGRIGLGVGSVGDRVPFDVRFDNLQASGRAVSSSVPSTTAPSGRS